MALQRQLRVLDPNDDRPTSPGAGRGVKVAFATDDLKHVNQHFGSAERFAIYAVEPEKLTLLEVAEFGGGSGEGTARASAACPPGSGVNENKLLEKFVVLDGCAAVYCQAVGGSAVRQLMQLGVQPLKVPEGMGIAVILRQLQDDLRAGPTGWLARAHGRAEKKKAERFDEMASEGWVE